jgi:putative sigma-54 modulation protein
MKINIKATGMELTPALTQYVNDKLLLLEKFIEGVDEDNVLAEVEIGKTTKHHKLGDFFKAEINLRFGPARLRVESTEGDLYAAIDMAKDELEENIIRFNKRKNTLIRKGARAIKRIIKGWYWKK